MSNTGFYGLWCISRATWATLQSGVEYGTREECEAELEHLCAGTVGVHRSGYEIREYEAK